VAFVCAKTACSGVLRCSPAKRSDRSITHYSSRCLHPGGDGRGTGPPRCVGPIEQDASVGLSAVEGLFLAHPPDRNDDRNPHPTGTCSSGWLAFLLVLMAVTSGCRCRRDHQIDLRLFAPSNRRKRSASTRRTRSPACSATSPGRTWFQVDARKINVSIRWPWRNDSAELATSTAPQPAHRYWGSCPRSLNPCSAGLLNTSLLLVGWRAGHPGRSAWHPGWQARLQPVQSAAAPKTAVTDHGCFTAA